MKRVLLLCSVLLASTTPALAKAPTPSTPVFTNIGANQVTLRLTANATCEGYFTLLSGANATAGTGAQTRAGLDSTGAPAIRSGALPLTADTAGSYTIRNLTANTSYTVCFTTDNGPGLPPPCATASFTTTAATDLTGGIWVAVQPTRFTPGGGAELTLAFTAEGAPTVAFRDLGPARLSGGQASVMTYNGTAWAFIGSAGFSRWIPNDCNLVYAPTGQPYVAYADYSDTAPDANFATVMTYNGTAWVPVGSPCFTPLSAGDVSLAISPTGEPWIAFQEPTNNFKVAVMKFDGTIWGGMGSSLSDGNAGDVKLAFAPDGTPYVAFRDDAHGSRASVIRFQGGGWQYVGGAGFTGGAAYYLALAFSPDGTPYLAFSDFANGAKACVVRFDGTSWVNVGAPDFSPSEAKYIFLTFAPDGQPWIGFRDQISGSFAASVMAFDGTNWVVRGDRGISAGGVAESPLAFAPDGTPYVAFADSPDGKISVKRLQMPVTPTITSVDVPAAGAYTTGNYLDLTVHFSTPVTMTGNGSIRLTIGTAAAFANYYSGSGTTSLVFRYQVQGSDTGAVSVYNAPIFMLYGAIENSVDATPAVLTLNNVGSTAGVTAGAAVGPTLTAPTTTNLGANQVTLQLRSSVTGTGYFTILPGAGAAPGTGSQVKAALNSSNAPAFRSGSLSLLANTTTSYTVGNLVAGTPYTVCFTADDGTTLQSTAATASFTTTAEVDTSALNWGQVGTTLSAAAADYDGLTFAADGTAYVAFQDYDLARKLTVKRFDGTNWVNVGASGFTGAAADFVAFAISPTGRPFVAFKDDARSYKATVMELVAGSWGVIGTAGFSAGQAGDLSLAFAPNAMPYVAYRDVANGEKATVMKWDGSAWVGVGSAGVTPGKAYGLSLAFSPAGQPYIAYRDEANGDKASVMKYDGTSWGNVGSAGFSAGTAYPSRLVFAPDGTPHLAFQDFSQAQKATVVKFSGGAWTIVGTAGFTPAAAGNLSLAFAADGTPHVGFTDAASASKATVMKFNGSAWVTVGAAGFSTGTCGFPSLTFAPNGRPWIAYKDNGNSGKATVMSLSAAATKTTPTLTWAAPAAITYGTALSSTQLNAAATDGATPVAGTFGYTPAAGAVPDAGANQVLSVTFTPADTTAYTSATATTTITVNKATAMVSLSGLSATYNGSPRAAVVTIVPSGLSNSVTYDGSATVPTNAGSHAVVATVTNANYTGTASGTLVIAKADQTITFDALSSRAVGDPAFLLTATASSTLPVTYASSNPAVATVSGATVTVVGAGSTDITATQAGNANYNAATAVARSLNVTAAQPPVIVVTRPIIYASPVSQIAAEGDTISLTAGVAGSALRYQWRKDGVDIPGAQSSTLTLAAITVANAGTYTLAVTNSTGTIVSAPATISVTAKPVAPTITTQPRSQAVNYGSTLTLAVTASGSAPLGYQWYKSGAPIAGATLATLAISPAAPKSAGEYTVAVTNAVGSVRSSVALVAVGPRALLRAYLGTFAGTGGSPARGSFALYVRDDGTGVFLAYDSASRFAYLVRYLQLDAARRFHFSMIPANPGGVWRAASGATLSGETVVDGAIGPDGAISGTLSGGVTATLTASEPPPTPAPAALAGFYEAGIAGTSAAGYFVVNDSLQTLVVTVNGPEGDAATGTIAASGAFSLTTENRAGIQGTINGEAATLTSRITAASGASVTCLGGNKDARKAVERMINVSGRGLVSSVDPLISGFIVTGTEPKRVLIRAVGPTLASLGVRTALTAARLEVFQDSKSIAVGTDWSGAANAAEIATTAATVGAFPLAANSHDAALVLTLAPGIYTAVVTGQAGATGVALAEVYDASPASAAGAERVVNISSRSNVGVADATLFSGFVVSGTVPKRVLIRAAGASLAQFGAKNALIQPVLTLWSGATVVSRNSDWTAGAESAAVAAASAEVGAFPLSSSGGDAALLIYLQPGAYCVQISGRDGATGVAVAEVYELP